MTTSTETLLPDTAVGARRWISRHGWTFGVWLLFFILIFLYSLQIPRFGAFQVTSIVNNGSPWVYLAVGEAIIVIAGGIDLGVGGLLVLTNATAARLMEGQPFEVTIVIALGLLLAAALLNGFVGWIIHVSKVPDIVITLGSLYFYQGLALWVLPTRGGGTSEGFRWLFTGSTSGIGSNPWAAIVGISVIVLIAAWWMANTRTGLSLYAMGSNKNAAFLSGIRAGRIKILSYMVGGAFAALAGLVTTAIANSGNANAVGGNLTLNAVAAIVLGGVALTGGKGSLIAVVPAGLILFFLNPVLSAWGVDPAGAQVIQGVLIVVVMAVGGILEWRRSRR
ncbi:MAG: ABC transporter permease [Acidimicrobiia bacterium]|nr:ABC transporter permease [Acidimicrobiia bacterium]